MTLHSPPLLLMHHSPRRWFLLFAPEVSSVAHLSMVLASRWFSGTSVDSSLESAPGLDRFWDIGLFYGGGGGGGYGYNLLLEQMLLLGPTLNYKNLHAPSVSFTSFLWEIYKTILGQYCRRPFYGLIINVNFKVTILWF